MLVWWVNNTVIWHWGNSFQLHDICTKYCHISLYFSFESIKKHPFPANDMEYSVFKIFPSLTGIAIYPIYLINSMHLYVQVKILGLFHFAVWMFQLPSHSYQFAGHQLDVLLLECLTWKPVSCVKSCDFIFLFFRTSATMPTLFSL